MNITEAREICQDFANRHKLVFEDEGTVGFGRPCVGFLHGDAYVDYNPWNLNTLEPVDGFERQMYTSVPDSYHKHDCMAVLVRNDGYDAAIIQLAEWVQEWEAEGELEVVPYESGYGLDNPVGLALHGIVKYAIRYVDD